MTARDKRLIKTIERRIALIEGGNKGFLTTIEKIQAKIWRAILKLLRTFSTRSGKLFADDSNSSILLRIDREVSKILKAAKLQGRAKEFLSAFDKLDTINKSLYGNVLNETVKLPINVNKKLLSREVVSSFSNNALVNQFTNPITRALFESVTNGESLTKAEERLKSLVIGSNGKLGRLASYAGQITRDSISRYDGAINDQIRDKFELEGFFYVGSLIKDSRQNCIDLVNGSGKFADLAIREGLYAVADIQTIISRAEGGSGFDPSVTPSNFASIRMGYNCRHSVVYVPLLEEEVPERFRLIQQTVND